jgi:SAM-dependent methyltransferase
MTMAQLYVSGISREFDEPALEKIVVAIAPVDSVEIVRDLESGEPRGYGVVRVGEEVAAEITRRLDGVEVAGSTIRFSRMPVTLPGEMSVRDWLHRNAGRLLKYIGVKTGYRVLDYGCGPGIFTVACAGIVGEMGKVHALDVRPHALEQVRQRATGAGFNNIDTVLQAPDVPSINLPGNSLDTMLIFDVIQDIKDKPGLLKEADRLLKNDGFLSVFPMHMGNEIMMSLVKTSGLFRLRDVFDPPNSKSPSSILNFVKGDH